VQELFCIEGMIGDKQHKVGGRVDCRRDWTMRGNTGIVLALKKTAITFAKVKSSNISALISLVRLRRCPRGTIGGRAPMTGLGSQSMSPSMDLRSPSYPHSASSACTRGRAHCRV
jgi:hypothetical protein